MPYAMKSLACDPTRLAGLSEKLLVSHYENKQNNNWAAVADTYAEAARHD